MRTLAVMQPYLFPYIGYFQLIGAVDTFILYDDVTFIKQGWINRNRILGPGGAMLFTAPVRDISSYRLIKDTEIAGYEKWRGKFLKTLKQNYQKAPYFKEVMELLETVLQPGETHIASLARAGIKEVIRYLGLETSLVDSSSVYGNSHLTGQERILDICGREKADRYINAINGRALYSAEAFTAKDIRLYFLDTGAYRYKQFNGEFVPGLSIIDILMFNSREEVPALLQQYRLVE